MCGKFKLITGLGNKDKNKVKDLVLLWIKAGADIFDTAPSVMEYVQNELEKENFNLNDYDFCVSVPINGDIHGKKAKIIEKNCIKCQKCVKKCAENAIFPPFVKEEKCIGCKACYKACKNNAIEFYDDDITDDLKKLVKTRVKIDTLEVHISIKSKKKIYKEFKEIIKILGERQSKISVCLNRKYFSNNKTEHVLKKLKEMAGNREFMVQADGISMNGGKNSLDSTIESVAFGLFVKSLGYNVILSGGCNEFTSKLVKDVRLKCSIAFGGFARKLTEGKNNDDAISCAKNFVSETKSILSEIK